MLNILKANYIPRKKRKVYHLCIMAESQSYLGNRLLIRINSISSEWQIRTKSKSESGIKELMAPRCCS